MAGGDEHLLIDTSNPTHLRDHKEK